MANLFKEVEEFHEVQSKMLDEEKREMGVIADTRLQASQNNILLDNGHAAYQLSFAQKWSDFSVPDPIELTPISGDTYMLTSHDQERACQLLKIDPKDGI